MSQAFKRLALILLPVSFFVLALVLSHSFKEETSRGSFCPSFLSFSFFSFENDFPFHQGEFSHTLLFKSEFLKKKSKVLKSFQGIRKDKRLFVFPLFLTKDARLIVSQKKFVILPSGERKEISHFNFDELKEQVKSLLGKKELLSLKDVLKTFSEGNLLFFLEDRNPEKLLKRLKELKIKTKLPVFFASSQSLLLNEIKKINPEFKILHTFKQIIRLQLLSLFRPLTRKKLEMDGVVLPSNFQASKDLTRFLEEEDQFIFQEKNPPYLEEDKKIKKYGIISSKMDFSFFKDCKDSNLKAF